MIKQFLFDKLPPVNDIHRSEPHALICKILCFFFRSKKKNAQFFNVLSLLCMYSSLRVFIASWSNDAQTCAIARSCSSRPRLSAPHLSWSLSVRFTFCFILLCLSSLTQRSCLLLCYSNFWFLFILWFVCAAMNTIDWVEATRRCATALHQRRGAKAA